MLLSTGTRLGPYEILAPLGAGGMGEVYRARDSRLDRNIAIKILPDHLARDPTALKRFEREAKAIAALSHPNILTIHDVGLDQPISYLVTELLEGETLRAYMGHATFSQRQVMQIAIGVSEGLAAAHSKGIIHRDLKPENIFLTSDGRVKILDFGLARRNVALAQQELTEAPTQSVETEVGILRGTVPYMSPEQIRGTEVDARTDIFSFGCVLYEMLSSRRAFAGKTPADTMSAILTKDPPELSNVSLQLKELIQRCLEKNPEQRFHSAHDISIALKSIVANSTSLGLKEPRVSKLQTPVLWLSGILAILTVIGLIAGLKFRNSSGADSQRIESIAVLPLDNLSGDPQQEYFADGMTEAFINELGQLRGLRVISRTSVMQYKDTKTPLSKIAHDLRVDAVLEGSVLQTGNRVEISANLLEPATEKRLWSKTYERDLRDVLSLRKEIARAIVQEIHLTITPDERTRLATAQAVDPESYRHYLRGNFHLNELNEDSFRKALADYQQAIRIDPNYAPAYAGMSMAYSQLGSWHSSQSSKEVYSLAKTAALKALELDEQLAEAHFALGMLKYLYDWDWVGADTAYRRGMDLNPRSSTGLLDYANYLTAMGRFKESVSIAKRAVDIDPLSPVTYNELSFSYWFLGNKEQAYEQVRKSLELEPDFHQTVMALAGYYAFERKYEDAIREINKHGDGLEQVPINLATIGWIYGVAGKRVEASKLLDRLNKLSESKKGPTYDVALIYIGLGDKNAAITMLEKQYTNHETACVFLKVLPFYDPLRDDPRFQALLQRMNFPN